MKCFGENARISSGENMKKRNEIPVPAEKVVAMGTMVTGSSIGN
jgi:hypothetical protein